jgi:hypothetical protein
MLSIPIIVVISILVRLAVRGLFFQKRELDTSMVAWTPPRHVQFGTTPPPPAAPQPALSTPSYPAGTFAPPPVASSGAFAAPPDPATIKPAPLPPPVDLNDVFRRPSA